MKNRPKIVAGDVVKLSKKGRAELSHMRFSIGTRPMVVLEVEGDGIEKYSKIYVDFNGSNITFYRYQIWKTGFNAFENEFPNELFLDENAPINNDGRNTCYICHMTTIKIDSFNSTFDVCSNINCKWYNN